MNIPIEGLQEALKHSPHNIPLRLVLVEVLIAESQYSEMLDECKLVLQEEGNTTNAKLSMASQYYQKAKLINPSVEDSVIEESLVVSNLNALGARRIDMRQSTRKNQITNF